MLYAHTPACITNSTHQLSVNGTFPIILSYNLYCMSAFNLVNHSFQVKEQPSTQALCTQLC